MKITESKLRSIIRQVIKEGNKEYFSYDEQERDRRDMLKSFCEFMNGYADRGNTFLHPNYCTEDNLGFTWEGLSPDLKTQIINDVNSSQSEDLKYALDVVKTAADRVKTRTTMSR